MNRTTEDALPSRRAVIKQAVMGGTAVWALPVVTSLAPAAAAGSPGPDPCEPGLLETIRVPVDSSTVFSTTVLQSGVSYRFRAFGTFFIGGPGYGDAEYAFTADNTGVLDHCSGDPNATDLGITINDSNLGDTVKTPADWGPFNPAHEYSVIFVGSGSPIAVAYQDCFHSDNKVNAQQPGTAPLTLEIHTTC